jgi:hypothetical protein
MLSRKSKIKCRATDCENVPNEICEILKARLQKHAHLASRSQTLANLKVSRKISQRHLLTHKRLREIFVICGFGFSLAKQNKSWLTSRIKKA